MNIKKQDKATHRNTLLILLIAAALVVWATLIGLGSYLFAEKTDLRKPLIVVGVMGAFLLIWMTSWMMRRVGLNRK